MSNIRSRERLRLALHRAGRLGRQLSPASLAGRVGIWRVTRGSGVELLIAPPDIRTTDPTRGAELLEGRFAFAGRAVTVEAGTPFAAPAPSDAWARELHGFSWLRHLRAADSRPARAAARLLVGDWLRRHGRIGGIPWETRVIATRVLAFLSQSPLILDGADLGDYRRFVRSLLSQGAELRARLSRMEPGIDRIPAAIALASVGLSVAGQDRLLRAGLERLDAELQAQMLPDGGHISRNPGALAEVMVDLLPFRQALIARGYAPSERLMQAAERILPMMRFFRHGDGSLARFNGATISDYDLTATILAYDDARGTPMRSPTYSGYERVDAGASTLLVDAGAPPPIAYSHRAHAGTLAFEFSHGRQPIVVNCGAPAADQPRLRLAARQTAAHSTATFNDLSSSRFSDAPTDPEIVAGPRAVKRRRDVDPDGATVLELAHDGYLQRIGMSHERMLVLDGAGRALVGTDRFPGATRLAGQTFTLRFHLHPAVSAEPDEGSIRITLPAGGAWRFTVDHSARIDDSVFFSDRRGSRSSSQIVIHGRAVDTPSVTWRLEESGD